MKRYLYYLIFLLSVGYIQASFAGSKFLNSQEIRQLIAGRDMSFYGNYGPIKFQGEAKWSKNGTIQGYTRYLSKMKYWQGRWYVKNNTYCRQLSSAGKKDFRCHRVKQINANTIQFIKPDGSVSSTTILK
ncbi:hypothetical protein [Legionella sp. W05-934-2]|jgi:tRNA(Ile2) C34 agmatinyltransferase TiaS|uniref:hypothetical protein n=1 Tax=Legionella sp. W05-934-2 TaxID=1198649 RepID=UPI00346281B3